MIRPSLMGSVLATLLTAGALSLAAQAGFSRVVLQEQPLSVAGRHAVTARADFGPGAAAGRHTHPGEQGKPLATPAP
jgi:hypothetical protein